MFHPEYLEKRIAGPRGGRLKVIIIDCAYDTIEISQTQTLLAKTIAMKIKGYLQHYPYGALPADSGDFVGTHILLCEELSTGLEPMMGMKFTTGSRCKIHHLEFPVMHVVDERFHLHRRAISEELVNDMQSGKNFAYSASWTMADIVRQDPVLANFCKHLNISFFYHYAKDYKVDHLFAAATIRFKVEQWKTFLGYKPVESNGVPLPVIECTPFFNELILLMHLNEFSPDSKRYAEQFNYLWNNRTTIDASTAQATLKKA